MSLDSEAGPVGAHGEDPSVGDPGAPVLLASLYDQVEAEILVAKLRSAGIDSFVKHEALSVVYGLTVDGFGQQDIMVRAEDLEVAQAALEAE
jgi:Putative prokaryotic signal transducing protein